MDLENMLREGKNVCGASGNLYSSSIGTYAALAVAAAVALAPGVSYAKEAKMNPQVRKLGQLVISEGRKANEQHCEGSNGGDVYDLEVQGDDVRYDIQVCDVNSDGVVDNGDVLNISFFDASVYATDKGLNGFLTPTGAEQLYNHPDSYKSERTMTNYSAHEDRTEKSLRSKQKKANADYLMQVGKIIKAARKGNSSR
ncbi:MAG: hypothetical protein ABIA62_07675 [Candidatus Woesearchaeota archaeon]